MSYRTTVRGSLTIVPPIPKTHVKAALWDKSGDDSNDLVVETTKGEDDVQVVDGEITVVKGGTRQEAVLRYDDDYDASRNLEANAKALAKWVQGEGSVLVGEMLVFGEESTDIWRLVAANNAVRTERVVGLVWEDGSTSRV